MSLRLTASSNGPSPKDIRLELFCDSDRIFSADFECVNADSWAKLVAACNDDTSCGINWKNSYIHVISHSVVIGMDDKDDGPVRKNGMSVSLTKGTCRKAFEYAYQLAVENDQSAPK